jgi:hypothetical protein
MLVILLGVFVLIPALSFFLEAKSYHKLWGVLLVSISLTLWIWVALAGTDPNVIESEKIYPIDTLKDGSQVVVLAEDRGRIVNLNVEMGRSLPPGSKVKRTVWRGVYRGIDFKVDRTRPESLQDTWELVKE